VLKTTFVTGITLAWAASTCLGGDIKPLDVKPGLWETTASTDMGGLPKMPAAPSIPPEVLAKMPPEQRARIEAMIKSRTGGGPMVTTTKVCITRESLSNATAFNRVDKTCTPSVVSSSGAGQQIHVECNREGHKMSGDLNVERVDTEHIKGSMAMQSGGDAPAAINMKMSFETKWVSTDCGDVKPPAVK
jgi:hypothetical protein